MNDLFEFDDVDDDTNDDDFLIYPFNLNSTDEYREMFDREAPPKIDVALTFLVEDETGADTASGFLAKINDGKIKAASLGAVQGELSLKYFTVERMTPHLRDAMSDRQKDWWYDGVYVQCGFWNSDLANDPAILRGVATAMTWYDASLPLIPKVGSTGPRIMRFAEEAPGDQMPAILARNFRFVVNTIFEEGVGVWNLALVDLRNEILVKTRAVLSGSDPESAWERFTKAALRNYLDYTLLPDD